MTVCKRCHRPLKNPPGPHGMGPTCEKTVAPTPTGERDLFKSSIATDSEGALFRVELRIAVMAAEAHIAVRDGFRRARVELLGWEARP